MTLTRGTPCITDLSHHHHHHLFSFRGSLQDYKFHMDKQTETKQKNTVITWSSTIFKFSAQYDLFSLILCIKNVMEYISNGKDETYLPNVMILMTLLPV